MYPINKRSTRTLSGALLVWCASLLAYWRWWSGDLLAVGMLWNLFLASVPLVFSTLFRKTLLSQNTIVAALAFGGWLLFFPNAPYVLTDLFHLRSPVGVPLWFLFVTLLSCGATGAWLGYLSLAEVQDAVARRWGSRVGWALAASSLFVAAFGIYLGRFLRWNSWDVFVHPIALLKTSLRQFYQAGPFPPPIPVTLVLGGALLLGYLVFRERQTSAEP